MDSDFITKSSFNDLFNRFKIQYHKIMRYEDFVDAESFDKCKKSCLINGKMLLSMATELGLFSSNDDIEKLSNSEIKCMPLSGYVAALLYMISSDDRMKTLEESKNHYYGFFSSLMQHMKSDKETVDSVSRVLDSGNQIKKDAFKERESKIASLKAKKLLEITLKDLEDKNYLGGDRDELDREIALVELKLFLQECLENYPRIAEEMELLKHRTTTNGIGPSDIRVDPTSSSTFKLTKIEKMNGVFGYGYPSLPTMTQEEYLKYELSVGKIVENYEEKPKTLSDDSEESEQMELERNRRWDEFKDSHRFGSGNRYNHG